MNLFLFTSRFPYGWEEAFLETEIPYLAQSFENCILVPLARDPLRRKLPREVLLENGLADRLSGLAGVRRTVFAPFAPRCALELSKCGLALCDPRTWRMVTMQWAGAEEVARWLWQYLATNGMASDENLFYSYWFDWATLGASMVMPTLPNARLITRAHGFEVYKDQRLWGLFPFRPMMLDRLERVFVCSQNGRDRLAAEFPKWQDRFGVARLGVADPGFVAKSSGDGCLRICSCSAIHPGKRLHLLVAALAELAKKGLFARISWDHLGDGPLRKDIERIARAELPPQQVEWRIHGTLSNSDVYAFYKGHPVDAIVNVSDSEGIPVSIMEAQSCGIPAIGPAVGGVPEIINERNGVLLDAECKPPDVARAIETVALSRSKDMRQEAVNNWRARYCASVNYPAFVANLRQKP